MPGGADIAVTDDNKLQYVHLAADWHLQRRLAEPAQAFAHGLTQVTAALSVSACQTIRVVGLRARVNWALIAVLHRMVILGWERACTSA